MKNKDLKIETTNHTNNTNKGKKNSVFYKNKMSVINPFVLFVVKKWVVGGRNKKLAVVTIR
jgi:hypothetical protein